MINSSVWAIFPANWYEMNKSERAICSKDRLWLHDDDLDYGFSHEELLFLRALPEYQILENGNKKLLLSHYAYPNLSGFSQGFYSWEKEFEAHFSFMKALDCSLAFTGHAHPWGFYCVTPVRFKQYGYRKINMPELPAIVGIPPVTRHRYRAGFCIYDSDADSLRTLKLL